MIACGDSIHSHLTCWDIMYMSRCAHIHIHNTCILTVSCIHCFLLAKFLYCNVLCFISIPGIVTWGTVPVNLHWDKTITSLLFHTLRQLNVSRVSHGALCEVCVEDAP